MNIIVNLFWAKANNASKRAPGLEAYENGIIIRWDIFRYIYISTFLVDSSDSFTHIRQSCSNGITTVPVKQYWQLW